MEGISIQTKNASYIGAIHNKKSASGVVGTFTGRYAKNAQSKTAVQAKNTSQTKSAESEERNQKLAVLEKSSASTTSNENLTQEELAERLEANKKAKKTIVFKGTTVAKQKGYLDLTKTQTTKSETKQKKKLHYSYKDVSSKIQRAKTSLSAGQAVISAKRKVMELRRKASSKNVDTDDLQLALSHAKKMEMIAKKKKHNLELEEMVEQAKAADEREEKIKDSAASQADVIDIAKESIETAEDEIQKQQEEYADGLKAEFEELAEEYATDEYSSEDLMEAFSDEMSEMIEEFGQEEMELLEETMEMLEQLEAVNPHMSDEQLDRLKHKHRASEDKAIAKANMEYLKGAMATSYNPTSIVNPVISLSIPTGVAVDVEC